ncbi:hypothetical protein [Mycolicibacterium sp. CH28]|uniref:hypothetical protein n=1 Tax=Mycolicibacterium sp. CH28 TaxID=2512237 RepID=UPI0019140716|nr:hypothetical protein [Mycolicibacterium sp. CH28]
MRKAVQAQKLVEMRELGIETARRRVDAATKSALRTEAMIHDARRGHVQDLDRVTALESQHAAKLLQVSRAAEAAARAEAKHTDAINARADAEQRLHRGRRDEASRGGVGSNLAAGGMSLAWAGAGPVLLAAAGAAAAATGALGLLPGAAAAAGAGIGSLVIATRGFSDAVKETDPNKFAAALQGLSPNARQAAQSIKSIAPAWHDLQQATQNSLFSGIGDELRSLTTTFKAPIQDLTTSIAGSLNATTKTVGAQLMKPQSMASIQTMIDNIAASFQQMAPASRAFTDAMVRIGEVGSSFLPGLAKGISDAALKFSSFIETAQRTGQLKAWIADGIDALKTLGHMAADAGKAFLALADVGRKFLPPVVAAVREVSEVLRDYPGLAAAAVAGFAAWKTISGIASLTTALRTVSTLLGTTIPASAAAGAAATTAAWAPFLASLAKYAPLLGVGAMPDQKNAADLGLILPGIPQLGGGPGAQRQRRGADELPGTNLPALPTGPGFLGGSVLTPTSGGWTPNGLFSSSSSGGGGGEADRYAGLNIADYLPQGLPTGGYPGDAMLLGGIPAGTYDASGDLAKGLGDCSSAVEDLVNIMDGASTAGRNMSTGNAAEWLTAHGFQSGYLPGAFNVGFNDAHMQATLPDGTPFNWGSNEAAARRGVGGTGALDPAFNQHYYRPVGAGAGDYQDVQRAGYDLARARLDEVATNRDPKAGQFDRTDAHQKVVEAGWKYEESLNKLLTAQTGTYDKLSTSADKFATGMQQLGAKIDDDFGISKGLPGIAENITKFLANLAFAPVLGALSGVTAANGTAGSGTGLLGAFAPRQNMFGQDMPNVLGQIMPTNAQTPGGYSQFANAPVTPIPGGIPGISTAPGMGTLGTPGTSPYAPLSGPQLTNPGLTSPTPLGPMVGSPGQGYPLPWSPALSTGSRSTPSMGITPGEGMPASPGIGIGSGGLLGLAGSAVSAAAGLAGGMGSMGGGGAAASAAAQIGIDEINRAIGFGAQAVGIGVQGLMETFTPVESQLADPMRGWFGRILGGIAGIRPAAQNLAGKQTAEQKNDQPLTPEQVDKRDKERASQTNNNTTNNVNVNAELHGSPDANAEALARATWAQNAPSGARR